MKLTLAMLLPPTLLVRFSAFACLILAEAIAADPVTISVSPRVTIVERSGITGGGQPLVAGDRSILIYPDHPDDFGGSGGTAASASSDGGVSWTPLADDWPMPDMIDLWADRLRNGDLLAFGIRWVPDPKKRGEMTAKDVPADACSVAISKNQGRTWTASTAVIDCPDELGVIARPLPHIIEDARGTLLMPAYAWGKRGTSSLLLKSEDRGRRWTVLSTITTAAAMVKAGAPVTTPWLETTAAITKDGSLLAIVRTGSNAAASLVAARSTDHGRTWSSPVKLPFAGKLPTLRLLPNGVLALLTAHTKNHCRIIASPDGTGREWGEPHIVTSLSGGNAGMTVADHDTLLIATPASRRIDAWRVSIRPKAAITAGLSAPAGIAFSKGTLTWTGSANAAAYQITPVLIKPAAGYAETQVYPHAAIQTLDATTTLDLARQLLIGGTYVFEVAAVDREGRVSSAGRSAEVVN